MKNKGVKMAASLIRQIIARLVPRVLWIRYRDFGLWLEGRKFGRALVSRAKSLDPRAILVCDLTSWPPTLGDFMNVVMLSRVLLKNAFRVTLVFENFDNALYLNIRPEHDKESLVKEWKELTSFFGGSRGPDGQIHPAARLEFIVTDGYFNVEDSHDPAMMIRPDKANLSAVASRILTWLWNSKSGLFDSDSFLLDEFAFRESELEELGLPDNFITWHLRHNPNSTERNNTPAELVSIAEVLSRNKIPIVVISTAHGYSALKVELKEACANLSSRFIALGEIGFRDSLRISLSGRGHFQLFAGGIGIGPAFSSKPYVSVQFSASTVASPRSGKLFPWSAADQFYFLDSDRENAARRFLATASSQTSRSTPLLGDEAL